MASTKLTTWEKVKMDIRERFFNFETAKGMYLVPAGAVVCFVTLYYQQHLLTAVGLIFGWYLICEGLRKIFVNRFKQERKQEEIRQEYAVATGETDNLPGVAATEAGITNVVNNNQVTEPAKKA